MWLADAIVANDYNKKTLAGSNNRQAFLFGRNKLVSGDA
jgi:hypothetical protein